MLQEIHSIKRASDNILSGKPRMRMVMNHDPEEIICSEVLTEAARIILENAHCAGKYREYCGKFDVKMCGQDVRFEVNCTIMYSPFVEEESVCTGIIVHDCEVTTFNEIGKEISNDFTTVEFMQYFR